MMYVISKKAVIWLKYAKSEKILFKKIITKMLAMKLTISIQKILSLYLKKC